MKRLADFIVEMSEGLPAAVADHATGEGLGIEEVRVAVPIESRIACDHLDVSLPRGRLATGFDQPHGWIRLHFTRRER